jgi:hypothetical protein
VISREATANVVVTWAAADCIHHLGETPRTVRMSLKAIGWIDAMGLSIASLRDPACMIKTRADFISNESAETTDRE